MACPEMKRVLDFWFDGPCKGKHYWAGGPQEQKDLDELIRKEFGALVAEAASDSLTAEWSATASGSLALVVLLDQMSRNIFRGTPKAFEQDPLAQKICLAGIDRNQHLEVSEATYHRWRQQFGGMKAEEAKRLKELELENARLKKLLAEAELDKAMLKEIAEGNF